jgi:hypothetical protein
MAQELRKNKMTGIFSIFGKELVLPFLVEFAPPSRIQNRTFLKKRT